MLSAGHILSQGDLPPKPVIEGDRAVFWVYVLGAPGFSYHGATVLVTGDVIDQYVRRFAYFTSRGYRPPLLAGHPAIFHKITGLEGLARKADELRVGEVLEVRRWPVDGRDALIAAISPAMSAKDAQVAVDRGVLRYFSPGLGSVETDEGDVLQMVLKELSVVTNPHQKTAGTHILGSEQELKMEEQELTLADIMSALQGVQASMKELAAAMMSAPAPTVAPLMEDEVEVEVVSEPVDPRVAELEKEVALLRERAFVATLPVGKTISLQLTPERVNALVAANRTSPEAVSVLLGERPVPAPPRAANRPIGSEGAPAPAAASSTPADLYTKALKAAGGDRVKAHEIYMRERRDSLA